MTAGDFCQPNCGHREEMLKLFEDVREQKAQRREDLDPAAATGKPRRSRPTLGTRRG